MRPSKIENGKTVKHIHGIKCLIDRDNKVYIADRKLKLFYTPMYVSDFAEWSEAEPVRYKDGEFTLSNFRAMVWKKRVFYINEKGDKVTI